MDIRCDVTIPAEVERAVARTAAAVGVPDVLVNNAGTFFVKPLEQTSPAEFSSLLAVNLTAPFLVAHAVLPGMLARGSGHVLTIGSISDYIAFTGSAAYGASKFGLRGMHEVIRAEVAKRGIRTTLVSPGPVDTPIWDPVDPDSKPGFTKRKSMLRAEDVAEAVLWAVTRPDRVDVTEIRLVPANYAPRG